MNQFSRLAIFVCSLLAIGLPSSGHAEDGLADAYFPQLQIPFGQGKLATDGTVLVAGTTVQAYIGIVSGRRKRERVKLTLNLPQGVRPARVHQDFHQENDRLLANPTLRTEGDIWFRILHLEIDEQTADVNGAFELRVESEEGVAQRRLPFAIQTEAAIRRAVTPEAWIMPADREGRPRDSVAENVLMPETAGGGLLRLLGADKRELHEPAGRVNLRLRNAMNAPCSVIVEYAVLDPHTREPVGWLDNMTEEAGLAGRGIVASTALLPEETTDLLINLNMGNESVLPGEYCQRVRVRLYGTDLMLHELERPLFVRKIDVLTFGISLFSVLVAAISLGTMLICGRWLFRGMSVREVVLIALFSACAFALIMIPDTVLSNLIRTVLGPFSFFVTGIFSEVVFYMLFTGLVLLVPRRGTAAGFIFVKFLLGAVLMGNLSILSVIWYPMRALVLELACYFSGLYEQEGVHGQLKAGGHGIWTGKTCWAAFVLGIADALLALCSFHLMMLFYRLFYAEWYVGINVLISGFLYTFMAIPLGVALGRRLRLVTED